MASIGMGLATGRKLWDEGRRAVEETERFLMGRNLFEQQLKLSEMQTEFANIEQEEQTRVMGVLKPYEKAIRSGDVEAFAKFLTDMSPEDNAVYSVEGNEVVKYIRDEDGRMNFDSTVMDATDISGPALLSTAFSYVETTSQLTSRYRAETAANLERLDKYSLEEFKARLEMEKTMAEGRLKMAAIGYQNQLAQRGSMPSFESAFTQALQAKGWNLDRSSSTGAPRIVDLNGNPIEVDEKIMSELNNEARAIQSLWQRGGLDVNAAAYERYNAGMQGIQMGKKPEDASAATPGISARTPVAGLPLDSSYTSEDLMQLGGSPIDWISSTVARGLDRLAGSAGVKYVPTSEIPDWQKNIPEGYSGFASNPGLVFNPTSNVRSDDPNKFMVWSGDGYIPAGNTSSQAIQTWNSVSGGTSSSTGPAAFNTNPVVQVAPQLVRK